MRSKYAASLGRPRPEATSESSPSQSAKTVCATIAMTSGLGSTAASAYAFAKR